ncbi:MAG: hypothetical protein CMH49_08005 [Myxococcales bacterium]|nr:hypothetical protein [Myxococcales bacterium]
MNFCKIKRQTSIILSLFFSSLLSGQALSLIKRSQDEVIREADLIVHGTVMKAKTHSTDQGIYTLNTVRVHENLKGQSSHTIYIYQSGGVHKGLSQRIIGQASLNEGEEWILFLSSLQNTSRSKEMLTDHQIQAPIYRILSGPFASKQVSTNLQGHKSVRLDRSQPTGQFKPTHQQGNSLKLVKVKPSPKLQLKAPSFKINPKSKPGQTSPTKGYSSTVQAPKPKSTKHIQAFSSYVDQLKTLIDRSLAPRAPTH